jgi:glycosyltransferase involved in cell wall biosynthesis
LFLNALAGGGAERNILALGHQLRARNLPVELVLAERRGPLLAELPQGLPCVALATAGRLETVGTLRRLPRAARANALRWAWRNRLARVLPPLVDYLRRARPAALVTTLPKNAFLALWARELAGDGAGIGTRIVVREANTFSQEAAKGAAEGAKSEARRITELARRWYPEADAIAAVSRGVAADLATTLAIPKARITTIYNGVDVDEIARRAAEPLEDPWLAPGEPPVVVSAGRLSQQKDQATLLRAFAQVRCQRPLRLVLLGEGTRRGPLEGLARELGIEADLRLPGFASNPYAWMARARVFALSSIWEGFPNVLLEALACGCPVVSSDCPHGPAEILENGRYGVLAVPGDADDLARALTQSLEREPLREPLRARARFFSRERAFERYLDLIDPARIDG